MKKVFAALLTLLVLLIPLNNVSSDSDAVIYGDRIKCNPGDAVRYSVNIEGNPGIAGFLISVYSENDWLYFDDSVERGSFTKLGLISTSYEPQRVNVLWFNADNVTDNGSLFTLGIHVSSSAPEGEYPIVISVSEKDTVNAKYNRVGFQIETGLITVDKNEYPGISDEVIPDMTSQVLQESEQTNHDTPELEYSIGDEQKPEHEREHTQKMYSNHHTAVFITAAAVMVALALVLLLKSKK